jgi:hypothetical protein
VNQVRRLQFAPAAVLAEKRMADLRRGGAAALAEAKGGPQLAAESTLPANFKFRTVEVDGRAFGYVRIWTFMPGGDGVPTGQFVQDVVGEFIRILGLLPADGLILDVRSNGGGVIMAGEMLLQLLTPRPVEPEPFQFLNTAVTRQLCERNDFFSPWAESIAQAVETGTTYSHGFPLDPAEECNRIGQQYHGPVVLITDARCYSTTDIFAAGFQDHAVGPILGTAGNTGAGGANVWPQRDLLAYSDPAASPLKPLPGQAMFHIALRRCLRVGDRSGLPVEDLGVIPNEIHYMTADDLLHDNQDLIAHATRLIADLPARTLSATVGPVQDGRVTVTAVTKNIDRLDVFVDGRPRQTLDVRDGGQSLDLPAGPAGSHTIDLRGYDGDRLVAARRVPL